MNSKEIVKKLKKAGFVEVKAQGKGSHTKLRHPDGRLTIVQHGEIPTGTLKAIERQTQIKLR